MKKTNTCTNSENMVFQSIQPSLQKKYAPSQQQ